MTVKADKKPYNVNGIYDYLDNVEYQPKVKHSNKLVVNERFYKTPYQKEYSTSSHVVLFKPDKIVIYKPILGIRKHKAENIINDINKQAKKRNGEMSRHTRNYCQQLLFNWLLTLHFAPSYYTIKERTHRHCATAITLTLSQKQHHDDKYIKRHLLDRFIVELKRKFNCKHYFWRAETQANGNIHFHIICDVFVHKNTVAKLWNTIQYDNGYLNNYKAIYNHTNAPSTHIQASGTIGCIKYITKYLSKEDASRRKIEGLLWGCSDELKNMVSIACDFDDVIMSKLMKLFEKNKKSLFCDKYFDVFFCTNVLEFITSIKHLRDEVCKICSVNCDYLYKGRAIIQDIEVYDLDILENVLNLTENKQLKFIL